MELKVGDRVLTKEIWHATNKLFFSEYIVREITETHIKLGNNWHEKDKIEIISKLEKKPIEKSRPFLGSTFSRECPLLKKPCNIGCAWYDDENKSCILGLIAEYLTENDS